MVSCLRASRRLRADVKRYKPRQAAENAIQPIEIPAFAPPVKPVGLLDGVIVAFAGAVAVAAIVITLGATVGVTVLELEELEAEDDTVSSGPQTLCAWFVLLLIENTALLFPSLLL